MQATLQAMHEWSSSIDTAQLLQMMAQGDTAAVQQIHDKAQQLVQQLEQQLQQVSEPVVVTWLRASAYDTFGVLLRTADWLKGLKDLHASQLLAELVKVRPGVEFGVRCLLVVVKWVAAHDHDRNCRAAVVLAAIVKQILMVQEWVYSMESIVSNCQCHWHWHGHCYVCW